LLGPAESGKTVLAAQIAAGAATSGWVRLARGHATAYDLVTLASASLGAAPPPPDGGVVELAAHLVDLLQEPTVLVVDDYHCAFVDECDPVLAEALALLGEDARIIVCSRARPPGLIGRAAVGLFRVVDANELAFSRDEAIALFMQVGAGGEDGALAFEELGGWASVLALAAASGYPRHQDAIARFVGATLPESSSPAGEVVMALSMLPYLTQDLAARLGLDATVLADLADQSVLISEQGGHWRLADAAVAQVRPRVTDERCHAWRVEAASALEAVDVGTAIELLLDDGDPKGAADLLHRHIADVSPDRAVPWLYRMPAEVRRGFPPALAAGRATVDLDAATATAERYVLEAVTEPERREALYGLGSAHLHAGRLGAASAALESACGPGSPAALASTASGWLAVVRWWAGDLEGALAAAAAAGDDAVAVWAQAEARLAAGDFESAAASSERGRLLAARSDSRWSPAACQAAVAKLALFRGDAASGRHLAEAAYQDAAASSGLELAVAGPVYAWYLVNAGEYDTALTVVDLVNRRVARHDMFASLHVHLVRLAVALAQSDRVAEQEAQERVTSLRQLGFAPVEQQARSVLLPFSSRPTTALELLLLGPVRIVVDGKQVSPSTWRSQKAIEVLAYLGLRGDRGAQREEVIEAVWPEREPDKGRMLLRAALSEIRRRLEPRRPAGEPSRFLHTLGERLSVACEVDVAEARALARTGRVAEALAKFRGELLEEYPYAEWAMDERRVTSTLRSELAERALRDESLPYETRVSSAELLIAEESWRDDVWDHLIALHRSAGNDAAAHAIERRRGTG
jgi:DNA-binding SARP family transcriptional activator